MQSGGVDVQARHHQADSVLVCLSLLVRFLFWTQPYYALFACFFQLAAGI